MSSFWNFLKRHRKKLALGAASAAAAYYTVKYIYNDPTMYSSLTSAFGGLQLPNDYVFDSYHAACRNAVLALLPRIHESAQAHLNVEVMAERLKDANKMGQLCLWNEMKTACFARLVALAYGQTLLVLSMKIQISLLARTYFEKSNKNSSVFHKLSETMARWNLPFGNLFRVPDVKSAGSASTHQMFLQSLQYFVSFGFNSLMRHIEDCVKALLKDITLKDKISPAELAALLSNIRAEVVSNDYRMLTNFVVPSTAQKASGNSPLSDNPELQQLLKALREMLCTNACRGVFEFCIDEYTKQIVDFFRRQTANSDVCADASVPLAKVLPILANSFYDINNAKATQSTVPMNILDSEELRTFCRHIFDNPLA